MAKRVPLCLKCDRQHYNFQPCGGAPVPTSDPFESVVGGTLRSAVGFTRDTSFKLKQPNERVFRPREGFTPFSDRTNGYVNTAPGVTVLKRKPLFEMLDGAA